MFLTFKQFNKRIAQTAFEIAIFLFFLLIIIPARAAPAISNISVNSTNIGLYEKFELSFDLNNDPYSNPFDPEVINVEGHFINPVTQQELIQPGFWYQDYSRSLTGSKEVMTPVGEPMWKIRFGPRDLGTWSYYITATDADGTVRYPESGTYTFNVITSDNPGFLKIAPNNKYLQFDNRDKFLGIGINLDTPMLTSTPYGDMSYAYDWYFEQFKNHGGNYTRIGPAIGGLKRSIREADYPPGTKLTWWLWPLQLQDEIVDGNYNLENAYRIDTILNSAKQNDVYFQLSLMSVPGCFEPERWPWSIYNSVNGGPCDDQFCFVTNETAKGYFKNAVRYMIARHGYSPNLAMWEFWNEWNEMQYQTNLYDVDEFVDWHAEMAAYIKSIDAHDHLVSTSLGSFASTLDLWNLEDMDIRQVHAYYDPSSDHYPMSGYGKDMAKFIPWFVDCEMREIGIPKCDNHIFNKPLFFTEGLIFAQVYEHIEADVDGKHIHNGLWAGLMSGNAVLPMSWWWEFLTRSGNRWFETFEGISAFIADIDFPNSDFVNINSIYKDNIINAGFERGDTSWSADEPNYFEITTEDAHSGNYSLKWSHSGTDQDYMSINSGLGYRVNRFYPGETYRMSYWVKSDLTGGTPQGLRLYYSARYPAYAYRYWTLAVPQNTNGEWVQVSREFTWPESETYLGVGVRIYAALSHQLIQGTFYIDDIEIQPVGIKKPPYSDNENIVILGLRDENEAYLWLKNKDYTWYNVIAQGQTVQSQSGTITIPNLDAGTYNVEWWNTYTGQVIRRETAVARSDLVLTLPQSLETDIAVKIKFSSTVVPPCTESWSCTTWNECSSSSTQARTCTDLNSCGTTENKPVESQSCTPASSSDNGSPDDSGSPGESTPPSSPSPTPTQPSSPSEPLVAGTLVKKASSPAVFYLGADDKLHVFPSANTYFTWYDDFSAIEVVSDEELNSHSLGKNVFPRPGVKLAQFVDGETPWNIVNPRVYAIGGNGMLRHITKAEVAAELYGEDWESLIIPVVQVLFPTYVVGEEINFASAFDKQAEREAASTVAY
jgi:hypothetical protein